jgi:hypothetical protein
MLDHMVKLWSTEAWIKINVEKIDEFQKTSYHHFRFGGWEKESRICIRADHDNFTSICFDFLTIKFFTKTTSSVIWRVPGIRASNPGYFLRWLFKLRCYFVWDVDFLFQFRGKETWIFGFSFKVSSDQ